MRATAVALLSLSTIVIACGGSGATSGDGGPGSSSGSSSGSASSGSGSGSGGGTSSAGVSLTVDSATSPSTVGGLSAPAGDFLLVVELTLKNAGTSTPLSTNPVLFSLQTAQSLVVNASVLQPESACSATVSVASGGESECAIAFEVPDGQTPAMLLYDDERGDTASAALPTVPTASGACESVLGWLGKGEPACETCLLDAEGVEQSAAEDAGPAACGSERAAYAGACGTCVSSCEADAGSGDLCSCEASCDTASCRTLFDAEMSCLQTACAPACN